MKLALIAATDQGYRIAEKIGSSLPEAELVEPVFGIRQSLENVWHTHDGIICIMAVGIVIRCISGLMKSKYDDPCIVVLDEKGNHVISLLSGHIGGGNELAVRIASILGATPVITTASDVSGHTSVDLWTITENLFIVNPETLASVSARLLNNETLQVYQEKSYLKKLPGDFMVCRERSGADIVISLSAEASPSTLQLVPRIHYLGIGCRRGTPVEEIFTALSELEAEGLDLRSVAGLASIDLKKDEQALLELAEKKRWPLRFFPRDILESVKTANRSEKVYLKVGTHSVSEASAICAAACNGTPGRLILPKRKWKQITIAVAEKAF